MKTEHLSGLIETLELLRAQVQVYERTVSQENSATHAMLAILEELTLQALNEANDLLIDKESTANFPHPFSPREHQVLELAATGLTNKEIAYRLGLSERTIQFHMNSIFNKTGTYSRVEAVALAVRSRWVEFPHSRA
jgi:DNA-binding NarL/FixJ family response regulator